MLRRACPWCKNLISPLLLGSKVRLNSKWYQSNTKLKLCPYCSNPVKVKRSVITHVLLFLFGLPLAGYYLTMILVGEYVTSLPKDLIASIFLVVFILFIALILFGYRFEKESNL